MEGGDEGVVVETPQTGDGVAGVEHYPTETVLSEKNEADGDDDMDRDLENGGYYEAVDTGFDPFADDGLEKTATSSILHSPVHLQWTDLAYIANASKGCLPGRKKKHQEVKATEKQILSGVSGAVFPGQMLAIMGSSGAGKTTLLNLLAGRLTSSKNVRTEGGVLVNGRKRDYSTFKRLSAYVEQDDNMFAEVTVSEQIEFSANLRLPKNHGEKQRKQKAQDIITELGLSQVKDSFIGNELKRGVSGGERKRVNIGTELVTDPSLIFLDEPTSGLDSFNALNVMHTLRALAHRGRTIVTTIHQPRSNIFTLFDRLLLLSKGRVMYFGPATDAVAYFSALNYRCPANFNPADFFIDLISVDTRSERKSKTSNARIDLLEDAFLKHDEDQKVTADDKASDAYDEMPIEKQPKYASRWTQELYYVMKRQFKQVLRAKEINVAALATNTIFSIILGLMWLNIGREFFSDPEGEGAQDRYNALLGVLFFIAINQAFGSTFSVIFSFPIERAVVLRERASATYRVSTYFVGKTITEAPRSLLTGILFSSITYWMIGLRSEAGLFFVFYITVWLVAFNAESMTVAISTLAKDAQVAASIVPVFMILALLFAGFLIPQSLIPPFLAWIQYVSFIKYGLTAITLTQFSGVPTWEEVVNDVYGNVSLATCYVVLVAEAIIFRLMAYTFLRINGPKYDRKL
eukprot:CAMPEP_0184738390 /NCGR_PEP_ID=MMETSP0315-20130426/1043_1 /TAXON_ID=101924 /ORGANISM="Rhodosorus marinus, Strain UTEX LB 2760" /LENGTH=689 /DNA_ID=CAMNT_0027206073 /DNA_START=198 /DNA_END=2267 /DNA_ORIENTATION=-